MIGSAGFSGNLGPDSARAALAQSGADGVMVGRGAQGRPWVLAQIAADVFGRPAPKVPQGAALGEMMETDIHALSIKAHTPDEAP